MADEPERIIPDERTQTKHCPKCGEAILPGQSLCPKCGASVKGVWPPPPGGFAPPAMPFSPKTLTGRAWADFLLGAAAQYLTHFVTAQTLLHSSANPNTITDDIARFYAPGIFVLAEFFWASVFGALGYYGLRRIYPLVAQGSGYVSLLLYAVLLGALITCHPLLY